MDIKKIIKEYYQTSDGQCFDTLEDAQFHQNSLEYRDVYKIYIEPDLVKKTHDADTLLGFVIVDRLALSMSSIIPISKEKAYEYVVAWCEAYVNPRQMYIVPGHLNSYLIMHNWIIEPSNYDEFDLERLVGRIDGENIFKIEMIEDN